MNQALMGKWWWKLKDNDQFGWWKDILKYKYDNCKNKNKWSAFWKQLKQIEQIVDLNCSYQIGNGHSVRYWLDKWCDDQPFSVTFYNLFKVCTNQKITVAEVLNSSLTALRFRRQLNVQQLVELQEMHFKLMTIRPLNSGVDKISWLLDKDKRYTTHSMYEWLDDRGVSNTFYKMIWQLKVPLKIKFFLWIVSKRRLLTRDNLLLRGWQGDPICNFCDVMETIDHLFFQCSYNRFIWRWFLLQFDVDLPDCLEDLWKIENSIDRKHKQAYKIWCSGILWIIWKNRNTICFNNSQIPSFRCIITRTIQLMEYWSGLWSKNLKEAVKAISPCVVSIPMQLQGGAIEEEIGQQLEEEMNSMGWIEESGRIVASFEDTHEMESAGALEWLETAEEFGGILVTNE